MSKAVEIEISHLTWPAQAPAAAGSRADVSPGGDVAVRVADLSKTFKIFEKASDMVFELVTQRRHHKEFEALRDVSFEVRRGEVVGVIGRNGAGKSTLLKILAGLMDYDRGSVEVNGNISAVLQIGEGFHPDYTGRENLHLAGMLMGLSTADIDRKLDAIIEFSELRAVIDQPLKTYSSGMQARLGFSLAMNVDPDIFIVDEALATGDAFFVSKCIRRIEEICRSGSTVLFVSHSMAMIPRFCHRVMRLDAGRVVEFGAPDEVCRNYELEVFQYQQAQLQSTLDQNDNDQERGGDVSARKGRVGIGGMTVVSLQVLDGDGIEVGVMCAGEQYDFKCEIDNQLDNTPVIINLQALSSTGNVAFSITSSKYLGDGGEERSLEMVLSKGHHTIIIRAQPLLLGRGEYFLSLGLSPSDHVNLCSDYYDYHHMRWAVTVVRKAVVQWVSYEQPAAIWVD